MLVTSSRLSSEYTHHFTPSCPVCFFNENKAITNWDHPSVLNEIGIGRDQLHIYQLPMMYTKVNSELECLMDMSTFQFQTMKDIALNIYYVTL